jgi:hypothetical protein
LFQLANNCRSRARTEIARQEAVARQEILQEALSTLWYEARYEHYGNTSCMMGNTIEA